MAICAGYFQDPQLATCLYQVANFVKHHEEDVEDVVVSFRTNPDDDDPNEEWFITVYYWQHARSEE